MSPTLPFWPIGSVRQQILGGLVLAIVLGSLLMAYGLRENIPFRTIRWGIGSSYPKGELVINDPLTWSSVWSQAFAGQTEPQINFTSTSVLAIFAGLEPTSGYSLNFTQVSRAGSNILVQVTLTVPAPSCVVAQVETSPFHIVSIQKEDLRTVFTTKTITRVC